MEKKKHTLVVFLLMNCLLAFTVQSPADEYDYEYEDDYGEKVKTKALSGLANIGTSFLEVPKNMINISNDSNLIWGVVGGLPYGVLICAGRIAAGTADLVTAYIPTTPITRPVYIWDDFDAVTTFGDGLRFEDR